MAEDRWIVVPNWDKFQHYKDRNPTWIKVYTNLLDNPSFMALPAKCVGLLFGIWMLYAKTNGEVPASPAYLAHALGGITEWEMRAMQESGEWLVSEWRERGEGPGERVVRGRDLKRLEKAGFITFSASRPLVSTGTRVRDRERKNRARAREYKKQAKPNDPRPAGYRSFDDGHIAPVDPDPATLALIHAWMEKDRQ